MWRRPSPHAIAVTCGLAAALVLMCSGPLVLEAGGLRSAPVITSVSPAALAPAATAQPISVNGRDFQARLELVMTTPEGRTTRYKDAAITSIRDTAFEVSLLLVTPGKYSLVVTNPDGGTSPSFMFEVGKQARPPAPIIERIRPLEVVRRSDPQDLQVRGQHFAVGLKVFVTDPRGAAVLDPIVRDLTATSFTLNVRLEAAGSYTVVVTNVTGDTSNAVTVVVLPAQPTGLFAAAPDAGRPAQ